MKENFPPNNQEQLNSLIEAKIIELQGLVRAQEERERQEDEESEFPIIRGTLRFLGRSPESDLGTLKSYQKMLERPFWKEVFTDTASDLKANNFRGLPAWAGLAAGSTLMSEPKYGIVLAITLAVSEIIDHAHLVYSDRKNKRNYINERVPKIVSENLTERYKHG